MDRSVMDFHSAIENLNNLPWAPRRDDLRQRLYEPPQVHPNTIAIFRIGLLGQRRHRLRRLEEIYRVGHLR